MGNKLEICGVVALVIGFAACGDDEGSGGSGNPPSQPVWELMASQVSPSAAESEDPTMLVTGTTPSVGYRHGSFEINLNTWDGTGWGTSKVHPESGNINGSIYGTPGFATDGTNVFVAYSLAGGTYSGDDAFYDRVYVDQCTLTTAWTSYNGGAEVSTIWDVTYGGADAFEPALAVAPGGDPRVAWVESDVVADPDTDDGAWVATVTSSDVTRSSIWSRDDTVDNYATDVRTVGLAVATDGTAYLAQWESDATDQDLTHLFVSQWGGGGFTALGGSISDDYDFNNLSVPSLAVDGTDVYVAYAEANSTDGTQHVYVQRWGGTSWTMVGGGPVTAFSLTDHFDSGNPSIVFVEGTLYVAWEESDQFDGPFIFVARWDDAGSRWVIDGNRLNVDVARDAQDPSLAWSATDRTLYVAFEEYVSGWPQIFVKRKVFGAR